MRVAAHVLATLRGPLLAVAVSGCTAAAPSASLVPEPAAAAPAPLAAIQPVDPVSYDRAEEAARHARNAQALASDEGRRARRIEEVDAARRAEERQAIAQSQHLWMRACGRG